MSKELAVIPTFEPRVLTTEEIWHYSNPDWHDHFPQHYYSEYYAPESDGSIPTDEQFTLSRFSKVLQAANLPTDGSLEAVVIGPGVTVDDIALVAKYANVTIGEYGEGARNEQQKWLKNDPTAYNWDPYIKFILETEGINPTSKAIVERTELVRGRIKEIVSLDARDSDPLRSANRGKFDIVVAPYCFESAARDEKEWRKMHTNGLSLGKPGALVLEGALSDCPFYFVGGRPFPGASINRTHIDSAFRDLGMTHTSIEVGYFPEHKDLGYNKVVVASGRLPKGPFRTRPIAKF